jgi:cytochrome P450
VIHRHPGYWPNPEKFDPERFDGWDEKPHPDPIYIPFLIGPRSCIGENFAMVEGQLILATLAQKFRLSLEPGQTVKTEAINTLRPAGGLRMTLELER